MKRSTMRMVAIGALCLGIALLVGCPSQQSDDQARQTPPDEQVMPGPDMDADAQPNGNHEPGEHMDDDHEPGEHMDENYDPGEHMDGADMHGREGDDGHEEQQADADQAALSGEVVDGTRVVEVEAKRYEFIPDPIVVEEGQPVRLEVTATDVTHGFGLTAMDIDVPLPPNETQTVEFTPEETGQFHIHCTHYCGPGHSDMHATLIVKE